MKRLGEPPSPPDGKWLAYAVTTVNLEPEHANSGVVAAGDCRRRAAEARRRPARRRRPPVRPRRALRALPFRSRGWPADLAGRLRLRHRRHDQCKKADRHRHRSRQRPAGPPTRNPSSSPSSVYPDCPAITVIRFRCRQSMQRRSREGSRRQQGQGPDLHPSPLSPLEPLHRRQEVPSVSRLGRRRRLRDLTPNDPHDVPPFSLGGGGCGCAFSPDSKELAFTENLDPGAGHQHQRRDLHPRPDQSRGEASARSAPRPAATSTRPTRPTANTSRGARKRGPATRATSFGWCSTTAQQRRSEICCRNSTTGSMSLLGDETRHRSSLLAATRAKPRLLRRRSKQELPEIRYRNP